MCLQSWGLIDYACALIIITADQELKEDMVIDIPNVEDDEEVLYTVRVEYEWELPICGVCKVTPRKPIWQAVSKKNSASSSVMKKNSKVSRKVMSSTDPFDVLNRIEEGDEIGSNRGHQIQMIERKLVLLDDVGNLLKPSKSMCPGSSNVCSFMLGDLDLEPMFFEFEFLRSFIMHHLLDLNHLDLTFLINLCS
uniref:Uncharacterized protein n=1 Tax=Tanacetum cinerariifolium TaxID=118510 RepID=A0A6L2MRD2_TANCI|nr:hypothetical protein [Tanacetum cinerariifolium]